MRHAPRPMIMRLAGHAAALALGMLLTFTSADAQSVQAFTRPAPDARVLLVWEADSTPGMFTQYFVYRRLATDAAFPSAPLNTTPIGPMTDCTAFQTVIPSGSEEWTMLARAFSSMSKGVPALFKNVCKVASFTAGSPEWQRLQLLAHARYKIALVTGQAWMDASAVAGKQYVYQLRSVSSTDAAKLGMLQKAVVGEVTVVAGAPEPVPAPANVRTVSGDAKVQVLWNKPKPSCSLFTALRSTTPGGTYVKVSESELSMSTTVDIDSATVTPESNGFTDYERFDSTGAPVPRKVPGNPVAFTGPANGALYYYRVRLRDIFGNEGALSDPPAKGAPVDKTPPATPSEVIVTADEAKSWFEIRWRAVRRDIDGRREKMGSYRIFRYETPDDPNSGATAVGGMVPQPADSTAYFVTASDKSGGLRSACGDKTYFFRVAAVDASGNMSKHSVAVGAALRDTTGPPSPTGVEAVENGVSIRVKWSVVKGCDIERYAIYRAYCDYGAWLPCPDTAGMTKEQKKQAQSSASKKGDCGGPFVFLGSISYTDAVNAAIGGKAWFDDAPPAGSPVCSAYLVKAQDSSQNLSGAWPVTDPAGEGIVCQRLRDNTAPEAAVISGLFALDTAIRVEYIGPPIQDIAAYHVYRSEKGVAGPYTWIGGMTVAHPPDTATYLKEKFTGTKYVGCDTIPLVSKPYMSAGVYIDRKAAPKTAYWYKVLGVDLNGNETSTDSAVGMSTFTFTTKRPAAPVITSVTPVDDPCALRIAWNPAFDKETMQGIAVFRGNGPLGPFMQLGTLVQGGEFTDRSVARETVYWYRISLLNIDGTLTTLSAAKSGMHP